jgi:hypothetical protein
MKYTIDLDDLRLTRPGADKPTRPTITDLVNLQPGQLDEWVEARARQLEAVHGVTAEVLSWEAAEVNMTGPIGLSYKETVVRVSLNVTPKGAQ